MIEICLNQGYISYLLVLPNVFFISKEILIDAFKFHELLLSDLKIENSNVMIVYLFFYYIYTLMVLCISKN